LKRYGGYYNFQRGTLSSMGVEPGEEGFWDAVGDRLPWARMGMDATDLADVTGATYTYLMNGLAPDDGWRGLFEPGERVRLRFVNASAASYFDVRIPGLPMRIVQADGMNVAPVEVDELRIAIAETYDVIVEPTEAAYTVFAESMDRSGFARGTLATSLDAEAKVPARRARPLLTMKDMGMAHGGMDMGTSVTSSGGGEHAGHGEQKPAAMPQMGGEKSEHSAMGEMPTIVAPVCASDIREAMFHHGADEHGAGNTMVSAMATTRIDDPGVGLRDAPWRVLTYADLRRAEPGPEPAPVDREIELHLTGNMER
jgi:CopA family copper-resistance protein